MHYPLLIEHREIMRNFLATFLAVILVLFGTMALSHVPRQLTAHEDVVLQRVANMTPKKSNKSKAPKANGVHIQISTSRGTGITDFMAITIPENQAGSAAPIELGFNIINNTSSLFPFLKYGGLIPELIAPDGQVLRPQEPTNREFVTQRNYWLLIEPGTKRGFHIKSKLFWQNNLLQLSIPTNPDYYWELPITPENSWTFDDLRPETYQLRFTYENPSTELLNFILELNQQAELEKSITQKMMTSFINLRLIEPTEGNKSAVEVDGIHFETILLEKVLKIPKRERGAMAGVKLGGIRITNKTPHPLHLSFYNSLHPQIVGSDGQILWRGYFSDWSRQVEESDFISLNPGEDVTFFPEAAIWWQDNDQFDLVIASGDGGSHTFKITELGNYKIQWNYMNKTGELNLYDQEKRNWKQVKNIWKGMVTTPFLKLEFIRA